MSSATVTSLGRCLGAALLAVSVSSFAAPFTPSYGDRFLVAGSSAPGFLDGNFIKSAFHHPQGLALSSDGKKLYVADTDNHAVRVIDVEHQDQVSTLCGNGTAGYQDGVGVAARLSAPTQVAINADGSELFVLDQAGSVLRLVDPVSGTVSTVFEGAQAPGAPVTQTASISALAMDPLGQQPLFLEAVSQSLMTLNGPHHRAESLGRAAVIAKGGLQLASVAPSSVYAFDPVSGTAFALRKGGVELFSAEAKPLAAAPLDAVAYPAQLPGAIGFVPSLTTRNEARLALWEPQAGMFKLLRPGDGGVEDFPIYDSRAILMSITTVPVAQDPERLTSKRKLFMGSLGLCFDPAQHLMYVSEKGSNRILATKLVPLGSANPDGLIDLDYPVAKAPGITRVLIIADSMAIANGTGGYIERDRQYSKQFEFYMNALNAFHGTGRRYEVLLWEQPGPSYMGSPLSKFLEKGDLLDKYKIDQVFLQMSHITMVYEGIAWSRGPTVADLSQGDADPSWIRLSDEEKEKHLGPLSRDFLAFLRGHHDLWKTWWEDWPFADESEPIYAIPLIHPAINAMILKKLAWVLALDKAMAAKRGIKLSVILMPYRNFIGMGELDGFGQEGSYETADPVLNEPFKALADKAKVPVYDPLDMMRLLDPALFPLFSWGDPHWLPRTHQWFAWMLSEQVFDREREQP